jgi:hypothetical protein
MSEPLQKLAFKLGLVDNPSAADVRKEAYAAGTRSVAPKKEEKPMVAQSGKAKNKPKTVSPDAPVAQADKAKPRSAAPAAPEAKKVVRDPRDVAPPRPAGNVRDRAAMDTMKARDDARRKKEAENKGPTPLKIVEKKKGEAKAAPVPKPKAKPEKAVVKVGAAKKAKSFKEGFAEARAKGREVFEWDGKKYNTQIKGEGKRVNLRRMKAKRASERQKILGR